MPDSVNGSDDRRRKDEQIAAEPPLAALALPANAVAAPVETHLNQFHGRLVAVAGIVEHGLVRLLDPTVKLVEHARVIIVTAEQI